MVLGIIKESQPDLVVHLGDLLDCYDISSFGKDPTRKHTLQTEIDLAREHLHQVSQLAPGARKILLGGNHEDRLRKTLWNLKDAPRALTQLRIFQKVMTWPQLLELDAIGWDFRDYATNQQPVTDAIPRLLLKHGDVARKWSGATAKAEWEKHAKSGMSGHCHRVGSFYHRDLNGSHVWMEAGCTCTLTPEYVRQPDWQQSCFVVTYSEDWFHIATVYIESGRAMWREKEFAA